MSKYFQLSEFIYSDTAKRRGINNTPSSDVIENLKVLAEVLDKIREAWGSAIIITSGYRCDILNKTVGGVSNSSHLTGNACDMQPVNFKQSDFNKFVIEFVASNNIKFDEIIRERSINKEWLHFALFSNTGEQRGKILNLEI